jgi:hypothetical protein
VPGENSDGNVSRLVGDGEKRTDRGQTARSSTSAPTAEAATIGVVSAASTSGVMEEGSA